MTHSKPEAAARHARASVKEAIGKLIGDDVVVAEGAAEKRVLEKSKTQPR